MRPRRSHRAYTLVEMLIVFTLASICLGVLYQLFFGGVLRAVGVGRRVEGEAAVRILLARISQELRHAVAPVEISNFGEISLTIPLMNRRGSTETPQNPRFYYSRYTFDQETRNIVYQKWAADTLDQGQPLESRFWMGGNTPVHQLSVEHTSENERILFQYYRVIVKIVYFDVKIKDARAGADGKQSEDNLIHVSTTIYPRRVNQELRIEVPQDGAGFQTGG